MKLKPTDLRIGNSVYEFYNHIDHKAIDINPAVLVDIYNDYGHYEPIPLKRTRLIKFGFEHKPNDNNGGCYSLIIKLLDESWSLEIWDYSSENEADFIVILKDLDFGKEVIIPKELQYVHQLQNLFHALTGEELTLNKDHE